MRIGIIDYEAGNLGSLENMFFYMGVDCRLVTAPDVLQDLDTLVLPGVGAWDPAILSLRKSGLWDAIHQFRLIPGNRVLGLCLGFQLMCTRSEEGHLPGLGWVDAEVEKFPEDPGWKVPHMGWNTIAWDGPDSFEHNSGPFYFAHSFRVRENSGLSRTPGLVLGRSSLGDCQFISGIEGPQFMGLQCHPEKSHRRGFRVLTSMLDRMRSPSDD